MKKNMKKILTLSVLGMFMFMFAMPFIAADPNKLYSAPKIDPKVGGFLSNAGSSIASSTGELFSKWGTGDLSNGFVKYLFWGLISMILYSVLSQVKMFKTRKFLAGILSIVVGFLSMAYITPDEVFVIMTSYSALGFVLSGGLPFFALIYFTAILAAGTGDTATVKIGKKAMAISTWIAFTAFIGYRAMWGNAAAADAGGYIALSWILFGACVLGLVFAIKPLWNLIEKHVEKSIIKTAKQKMKDSEAMTQFEAEKLRNLAGKVDPFHD
jgi:uncharacterized membrane protein